MSKLTPEQSAKCDLLEIYLEYLTAGRLWSEYGDNAPIYGQPSWMVGKLPRGSHVGLVHESKDAWNAWRTADEAIAAAINPAAHNCEWKRL